MTLLTSLEFENFEKDQLESYLTQLQAIGIKNEQDFLLAEFSTLLSKTKIPVNSLRQIETQILNSSHVDCQLASELFVKENSSRFTLSTGSKRIDQLLGGGFISREINEVSGPPGAGKTQLALQMTGLILVQDPSACVIYLDISRNFCLRRINEIIHHRGYIETDIEVLATRIKYSQCNDVYSFMDYLETITIQLKKWNNTKLLVIDSITSIFSPILGVAYIKGRAMMYSAIRTLQQLAQEHNLVVLIINSAVGNHRNLERSTLNKANTKPALGSAWSNLPYTQIFLSRNQELIEYDKYRRTTIDCQILKSHRSDIGSMAKVELSQAGIY
ncbi:hypothetical protein K7432_004540 [Basidiobolus ranarum]|uniref:RecA family profile 1 domain-containing protein n=1 Tax=Basidiobolus ranarum TaxID=34480 RepID=A0ABR2WY48_9FUNG